MRDTTLRTAVAEAIRESQHWMGGAVVVRDGDAYYAYPGAYMSDISYTGSRNIIWRCPKSGKLDGAMRRLLKDQPRS
jgi:hypothetical protein